MTALQISRIDEVVKGLADHSYWLPEPNPERWMEYTYGTLNVRVRLAANVNGVEVQVNIPTPDGSTDIVWLGIVSHRLGEGYCTDLVRAMVEAYVEGYVG